MDTLSFIVPVYNVEKYIASCIESLLHQNESNGNIEIILVDDGSTDRSFEICKEYERQFDKIKVFHQKNMGANVARNLGLEQATGEWVCFVDSDDWVDEELYRVLSTERSKDWDIIIYSYKKVTKRKICSGAPNAKYMEIYGEEFKKLEEAALNKTAPGKYNSSCIDITLVWNKLYRRKFLQDNHLQFEPSMTKIQDLEFNLNVYSRARKAVYLDKELYYYRINEDSVTHRYQPDIIEKFNIVNSCIEKFVKNNLREELEKGYYERIATHFRTIMVLYLCNKENKEKYSVRKRKFLELLETEPYATAMKKVNLSHFPFKERVLSTAIKYHSFLVCNILYWMEEVLKRLYK